MSVLCVCAWCVSVLCVRECVCVLLPSVSVLGHRTAFANDTMNLRSAIGLTSMHVEFTCLIEAKRNGLIAGASASVARTERRAPSRRMRRGAPARKAAEITSLSRSVKGGVSCLSWVYWVVPLCVCGAASVSVSLPCACLCVCVCLSLTHFPAIRSTFSAFVARSYPCPPLRSTILHRHQQLLRRIRPIRIRRRGRAHRAGGGDPIGRPVQ